VNDRRALTEALEAHRSALVSEIEGAQTTIADETRRLNELQMKLESVLELMRLEGVQPIEGGRSRRHFLEEAHDLLLGSGPLHYTRLAELLRERGSFIPGVRPEMNLLTHINRDRRFERVARGVYRTRVEQEATRERPRRSRRERQRLMRTKHDWSGCRRG
jgi:hypothetical protein